MNKHGIKLTDNMKKILSFAFALAAVSFAVSCNKETAATVETETVTFSIELPGAIQSKAIADGEKAKTLYYATYTKEGKQLPSLSNTTDGADISGKTATVTLQLVKDIPYHVVFWAQDKDCQAFTFDWANATMTVSYDGAANDDLRDAFYAVVNNVVMANGASLPTGDLDGNGQVEEFSSVNLKRPFAQINFGTAQNDYDSVTEYYDVASVDAGMKSAFVCSAQLPNVLNLLDRSVSDDASAYVSANFTATKIPNDPYTIEVNKEIYRYVAMNYVLAGDTPIEIDEVTATFTYRAPNSTADDINRPITVFNVPILRNYRTNIIGDLFTVDTKIEVVVVPNFDDDADHNNEIDDPDHIITVPQP